MDMRDHLMEYFRIVPLITALLMVAILPATPNAFFWVENNSDLGYSFRWFSIPALILSFSIVNLKRCRERLKGWERYLSMPFLAALIVLILNGPVLLVNATVSPQIQVVVEGVVVEKVSSSAKSNARIVFVDNEGVLHRWPVHSHAYKTVNIGDHFRIHAIRGGLGLLYVDSDTTYWEVIPFLNQWKS